MSLYILQTGSLTLFQEILLPDSSWTGSFQTYLVKVVKTLYALALLVMSGKTS